MSRIRLGVNIDHVATIRNARGGLHPDPVRAAQMAIEAGADGITAHLREDRRHITDDDMDRIAELCRGAGRPLNFEMAVTDEMLAIALAHKPHAACLVPERREERTTEGGLDVAGQHNSVAHAVRLLKGAGVRVSLFIEANPIQIEAAQDIGAQVVELHTGAYCEAVAHGDEAASERYLNNLVDGAADAAARGLEVHAGHGLDYVTVKPVAAIPQIAELNIGHFLIGEAIFIGLGPAIRRMRELMDEARA
ncbi:MAG: pyridoxine 5'-phosphate synthase [Parcubacteria group bacterium]